MRGHACGTAIAQDIQRYDGWCFRAPATKKIVDTTLKQCADICRAFGNECKAIEWWKKDDPQGTATIRDCNIYDEEPVSATPEVNAVIGIRK